jgi:integrase
MWKGTRYRIGCHELLIPRNQWTKEGSGAAANAWWEKKLTELQAARLALHPHAERIKQLTGRKEYANRHGLHDEAEIIDAEILRVQQLPVADPDAVAEIDHEAGRRLEGLQAIGVELPADTTVLQLMNPSEVVWGDRLKREQSTPLDRTIGALVDRWLTDRQDEAKLRVRSNESADSLKRCLYKFRDHVGAGCPVEHLTADVWHRWYVHVAGMVVKRDTNDNEGWSADTAAKIFTVSRSFVKWLWERDILANLPKNLTSKQHKFERPEKAIPTFTNDEIKTLISGAQGIHRLILLLMLNTGATQKDIADLRKDQIDLTEGRITRCRSKTAKKKSGRTVSYKLWPEVVELLKEYMAKDGDRALVTKSGKPWVWTEMADGGKMRKSDNVATVFNNLKRKLKMDKVLGKSLKVFRKTSATRLKGNKDYRDLRFLFLGHSTRNVADRHYAKESQTLLDEAVNWLRTDYELITQSLVTLPTSNVNG